MDLADHAKLAEDVKRVEDALLQHHRVLVIGPTGSGRGQMMSALRGREDVIAVEAPPLSDSDAPVHPLFVAAAALGLPAVGLICDGPPLDERAALLATRIVSEKKTLVLRLPASWRVLASGIEGDPDRRVVAERANSVLAGLTGNPDLPLVVLAEPGQRLKDFCVIRLRPMRTELAAATKAEEWGAYGLHAQVVSEAALRLDMSMTPVQYRLAVGLIGLGERADRVLDAVRFAGTVSSSLEMLEKKLVVALRRQPEIGAAVLRLALARFGLPRSTAISISQLPAEHAPLVTECLGYGNATVAMHERVRSALLKLAPEFIEEERAHHSLADYHRQQDGTLSVTDSSSVRDWLERAFHLGLSGDLGAEEWEQLELPSRELYWTRGRALSLAGHYEAAAAVYRACAERYGDDDYSLHYQAFNRDRAGIGDAETEALYRGAIEIAGANAWWNARLVTFLIDRARFIAARAEWADAIKRVDPDGDGGTWVALHFHRWVVTSWMEQGQVELAREAFDAIASETVADDIRLHALGERLGDAEEAARLGHAVYPASVPLEERWLKPNLVPTTSETGARRLGWYPARIVDADEAKVLLVVGLPPSGNVEPRVALKEMPAAEWRAAARRTEVASGFWEIGSYEDGSVQAIPVPAPPPVTGDLQRDPLRFAKRWLGTQSS